MFNNIESNSSTLRYVVENRLGEPGSSEAVLSALSRKHDFGEGFFHKILTKSILRPNSAQAKP